MYTYQDLVAVGENEQDRMQFCIDVVEKHKNSDQYKIAYIADQYDKQRNTTIVNFQKFLYTISGKAVPDNWSANYKLASNFFHRFITQQNQFLLGNGIQWQNGDTAKKLGEDFDIRLQNAGHAALSGGLSFGFWNLDHMDVFKVLEFAPLWDEETGGLRAGVRWWQIDEKKPLRMTLYEEDGYTEYRRYNGQFTVLKEKQKYKIKTATTAADGTEIIGGENYPSFPIVPFWGNPQHQSEIVGIREQIDAYDLIKSGFCNTIDEASMIYWTLENAGGMDDTDLAKFMEQVKRLHATAMDDEVRVNSHSIEAPFTGRGDLLDRLRKDLYEDYMALDTKEIASGAATATQIRAAYEPLNSKADSYEYCVHDFLRHILEVAGIDDTATFTRSTMINASEEITNVLQAAQYLSEEYVTEKIMSILGDADRAEEILEQIDADELDRNGITDNEE